MAALLTSVREVPLCVSSTAYLFRSCFEMNALFFFGFIFNDCLQNMYFLYYCISFEINYYF